MNQHVTDPALTRKKPVLWTPWGSQAVPDLDKALDARAKPAKRRKASVQARVAKAKPVRG